MTPPELCQAIVEHFRPCGRICEPCYGTGNFINAFPPGSHIVGFELNPPEDRSHRLITEYCDDFLKFKRPLNTMRFDWIVTNPPYSKFRAFLLKSMEVANNVVFLCPINHLMTRARQRDIRGYGFGMVEVLEYPLPPKPWPPSGFAIGACWLRRGWTGSTHFSRTGDV